MTHSAWYYIGWSTFSIVGAIVFGIVIYGFTLLFVEPGEWISKLKKKFQGKQAND